MSSSEYLLVEVSQQPIELCKLLKIADLVSGGGEAKVVISEGYVYVNGEVEFQKRKKIYHQDVIEFNGEVVELIVNEALNDEEASVESDQLNVSQTPHNQAVENIVDNSKAKPSQANSKQAKPNKAQPNKAKSKKAKPTKAKPAKAPKIDYEPINAPAPQTGRKRKPISF